MKKSLLVMVIFVLSLVQLSSLAEQPYYEVTAPTGRHARLGIASPVHIGGSPDARTAKEISDVLKFDLSFAGPFEIVAAPATEGRGGIRPGEFDFTPWQSNNTELLVKAGYLVSAGTVTVEFRLYDVIKQDGILAKRYTGKLSDLRKIAHTFSDDVLQSITGERGPFTGKIAYVSTAGGGKELYLMDYDGYNQQPLTRNRSINLNPDFSPSGKELVFTSYKKGNPDLYRRELFTGTETRIAAHSGTNSGGAWAPDGNRIALSESREGNAEIYVIDKGGQQLARLTHNPAIDISPTWSPDGKQIAFVSDRLGSPQIFIMSSSGGDAHRLTTTGSYNVSPRWSPKGDLIAYSSRQEGSFQIHIIRADGSGDIQITTEGSNEHPRWSPDGRFITFSSKRGGTEGIYIMRSDGSNQVGVSQGKGRDWHPAWSPRW